MWIYWRVINYFSILVGGSGPSLSPLFLGPAFRTYSCGVYEERWSDTPLLNLETTSHRLRSTFKEWVEFLSFWFRIVKLSQTVFVISYQQLVWQLCPHAVSKWHPRSTTEVASVQQKTSTDDSLFYRLSGYELRGAGWWIIMDYCMPEGTSFGYQFCWSHNVSSTSVLTEKQCFFW